MAETKRDQDLDAQKIEQQTRDGVIVLTFDIEPIPTLTCVLPASRALKQLAQAEHQLRSMPYPNLLRAVHGEFTAANQSQEDRADIEVASIFALYAVLHNPLFGGEVRALLAEVRRNRHNLGLMVVCQKNRFAFGVSTGLANVAMNLISKSQEQEKFPTQEACASETVHLTLFEPLNDRPGATVSISIPETPKLEIRHALNIAIKAAARTTFTCDTAEQAEAMALYATSLLPRHRRMACPASVRTLPRSMPPDAAQRPSSSRSSRLCTRWSASSWFRSV